MSDVNQTWFVTLPTADAVVEALSRRITRVSAQIDVIEAVRGVLRERVGKRVDKRLDDAIKLAIAPALAARQVTGFFSREPNNPLGTGRRKWRLRWFQQYSGTNLDISVPSGEFYDDYTLDEVETVFSYSAHPNALRIELAALQSFRDDRVAIEAKCKAYADAVRNVKSLVDQLGPDHGKYTEDGRPDGTHAGPIYPLSQLFPGIYITNRKPEVD